ncbi:MAG: DUF262 domain-containing HNH endonuclease family protein [Bacteroidota bacterium]
MTYLKPLKIRELFSSDDKYIIPIYQRNFAWGETEITQLVQDIADYALKYKTYIQKPDYYIGSLVVAKKKNGLSELYETIDGQQRLTSLTIFLNGIKHNYSQEITELENWLKLNLKFESRPVSTNTLEAIFKKIPNDNETYNTDIVQAYNDAIKKLKRIVGVDLSINEFCEYFFNNVVILRVEVPEGTDLNHYFEIMNNRGEQLEKHEIVKAYLLNILHNDLYAYKTFNMIWEACSNMDKYVQYGFDIDIRHKIFGFEQWDTFNLKSFDEIISQLKDIFSKIDGKENTDNLEGSIENCSIENLIKIDRGFTETYDKIDDGNERFNSLINFPNFLLHILKIQLNSDVQLDDKQLIKAFEDQYKNKTNEDAIIFVKQFAFNLLKGRFLFDRFIIKRELKGENERWSLKHLNCRAQGNSFSGYYTQTFGREDLIDENNTTAIMLLSMFHVSAPNMIYKNWMNAALKYIIGNDNITVENYIFFLEKLADAYLLNNYVAINPLSFFEIIYTNYSQTKDMEINHNLLDKGTSVENFIFNYLDYLLWKNDKEKYPKFEFILKSSVEHFYPQNPVLESNRLSQNLIDKFGNLCLLTRSKNSKLSNAMPNNKKEHYASPEVNIDSIKQQIMLNYNTWNVNEIEEHGSQMKKVLLGEKYQEF